MYDTPLKNKAARYDSATIGRQAREGAPSLPACPTARAVTASAYAHVQRVQVPAFRAMRERRYRAMQLALNRAV